MNATELVIATIEWSSQKGDVPVVFVATSRAAARRAALEYLIPYLPGPDGSPSEIYDVDEDFLGEYPLPDLDDADEVEQWFGYLWEETTDARLTIFVHPAAATGSDDGTFIDGL